MVYLDIINIPGYFIDHTEIRSVIEICLSEKGVTEDVEVAVTIVGEERMAELHEQYMGVKIPTDVLSFPLEEGTYPDGIRRLGDIVICHPVAVKQAEEGGRETNEEVAFLVDHGLRHLLGEHHDAS